MQNSTDYYAAAWLGACLVRYNQPDAQKIMQGFLDQKKYREAAIIATQLASYAQSPNGNSDWLTEVEKVRTTLVASTDATYTARQDYDTILGVVPDLTSAAAANTLEQLGNGHNYGAIQSLGWALAPHNTAAVNTELLRGIDQANLAKDNSADSDREIKYSLVGELGRALTPYAVEVVAESMKHIDDSGVNSGQANDAQQRIATGFVPYKPDATVAYIKDGSEDPAKWQTHRWNMTTLVALGQTDPAFVASMRQNITSSPYVEWIDASLDPLLHLSEAETVLPTFKGIYLSDAAHLLDALLRSRQPKAQ